MSPVPDYRPPWGDPQEPAELAYVHGRWYEKLPSRDNAHSDTRWTEQCGGCCYYIPLEGSIGADWGACSNERSPHDRTAVFEHYGCSKHSRAAVKVYFDLERNSPQGWMRTRSVEETIDLLGSGDVTHLSLDVCGEPVLRWIERAVREDGFEPPEITIHSTDPVARARMDAAVRKIGKRAAE